MTAHLSPAQVATLLDDLCLTYGFCLPPAHYQRLQSNPPTKVDAFTDAVFTAEGLDPWSNLHLRRTVKRRIAKAFWDATEPCAPTPPQP